jgi:hypothetical protein
VETEGRYVPPEAKEFVADPPVEKIEEPQPIAEDNPSIDHETSLEPGGEQPVETLDSPTPETFPLPSGTLKEQLHQMQLPENTQRALNARMGGIEEMPSRITPELMMSAPGRGEWAVTRALDMLGRYGVRAKTPDQNDPINAIGLDHARNDRLRKLGIETFGQLMQVWSNPLERNRLVPDDSAMIAHRLNRLGLMSNPPQ